MPRSVLTDPPFSHHHSHLSNGLNRTLTRVRTRLRRPCQEGPQIRYPMHLASCQVPRIRPTPRVSIPSLGASTATHLTQRHNHLFLVMVAFHYLSQCRIMALRTMDLRTTALPISLTMPSLHPNNNTTMAWVIVWLDKVLTTLCRLTMHHLIWLIGR